MQMFVAYFRVQHKWDENKIQSERLREDDAVM